jgi:hypothetical protein
LTQHDLLALPQLVQSHIRVFLQHLRGDYAVA